MSERERAAHACGFRPQVFGCVQTRDLTVTVLSDCSAAEYKTPDYLSGSSVPFLRSLRTGAHKGPVACPPLEQPNISTGLAAAGTSLTDYKLHDENVL